MRVSLFFLVILLNGLAFWPVLPGLFAGNAIADERNPLSEVRKKSDLNSGIDSQLRRLAEAYPDVIDHVRDDAIIWKDGTVMPNRSAGSATQDTGADPYEAWLASGDLVDIFRFPYPVESKATSPAGDPGRARPARFFDKVYGDCRRGEVKPDVVSVPWMPGVFGGRSFVQVTRRQGVADRVAALSQELQRLPIKFHRYLRPLGGGYVCRTIAGTTRLSAHGYGIAIDIAVATADYWRWGRVRAGTLPEYRNRIPQEIVAVFEAYGFIWGGRWRHFDTMHFEYRPELLPPKRNP